MAVRVVLTLQVLKERTQQIEAEAAQSIGSKRVRTDKGCKPDVVHHQSGERLTATVRRKLQVCPVLEGTPHTAYLPHACSNPTGF